MSNSIHTFEWAFIERSRTVKTRPTKNDDVPALTSIVEQTELFPSDMLPQLLSDTNSICLTCELSAGPVGFCYAVPEELADGTWNMLAIAVAPSEQGSGVGASLVQELEQTLKNKGARVLIADTSGADVFTRTREFYRKQGYLEVGRIPGFWAAGEDKVVFWKAL